MSQKSLMTETELHSTHDLIEFFQSRVDGIHSSTRQSYHKALATFETFLTNRSVDPAHISGNLLDDWLVDMCLRGMTFKTASHYFDIMASMYNAAANEGLFADSSLFKHPKEKLKSLPPTSWAVAVTDAEFKRMENVTRTAPYQTGDMATATDMLLFSLLNGAMNIYAVARLRCDDWSKYDTESAAILRRNIAIKRRYVFNLHQSMQTPRQLDRNVNEQMLSLLHLRNLPIFGTINDTIETYWAYAALSCGYTGGDITAALGHAPKGIPILSLCRKTDLPQQSRDDIREAVSRLFVANPMRWYAMRLRPAVKFDDLHARFQYLKDELQQPEMFYPCDEIVRRTGKKIIAERRPVIADVVFFHCRVTDIFPMFCKIGDLAWCYTTGATTGTTYASIPENDFRNFQLAIGQFTPQFEVAPIGGFTPKEGDRIVVVGGMIPGQTGDIAKIESDHSENIIYRIKFGTQNGFKWDFGVDARITRAGTTS